MIELGRVCIKIAGRDAGEIAIVVEKVDDNFVLIDGNVRRRKCNISHLEQTDKVIKIKKSASTEDIHKAMSVEGLDVKEKKVVKRTKKEKVEEKKTKKKTTTEKIKETKKK